MSTPPKPPAPSPPAVTQLLALAGEGDSQAAAELLPLVYSELRRLAHANMAEEKMGGAGQTLQATALVHEAYMRLLGPDGQQLRWDNRGHFFGAAARAMRRILVDRARSRNRIKRGGGAAKVELDENAVAAVDTTPDAGGGDGGDDKSEETLAMNAALDRLEKLDKRKAEVVMLRYFAGLSIEQTAEALKVSPATVKNDWAFARAWLSREITTEMNKDA